MLEHCKKNIGGTNKNVDGLKIYVHQQQQCDKTLMIILLVPLNGKKPHIYESIFPEQK